MSNRAGTPKIWKWFSSRFISAGDEKKGPEAPSCVIERGSDVEALAAAALILHVGIVELESLVQAFAREIELGAVEVRQALGIDDDLDAVALESEIVRIDRVCVLELV